MVANVHIIIEIGQLSIQRIGKWLYAKEIELIKSDVFSCF